MMSVLLRDIYVFLLLLSVGERLTASEFLFDWMRWYVVIGTTILVMKFVSSSFSSFRGLSSVPEKPPTGRSAGPKLSKTTRCDRTPSDGGMTFEFVVCEMQGWRDSMEDAALAIPRLQPPLEGVALFSVFDGHGGPAVSRICASTFPGEIQRQADSLFEEAGPEKTSEAPTDQQSFLDNTLPLHTSQSTLDLGTILTRTYAQVDAELLAAGSDSGLRGVTESPEGTRIERKNLFDFTGCTAVTALLTPNKIVVANAGDSRCLLCRNGVAIELSHDHKPESPRERSRIEKAGGKVTAIGPCFRVDWGLNLSRSLGDFAYKRNGNLPASEQKISSLPDLVEEDLIPEDEFIVLACDGLFELLTSQQVVDFVRAGISRGMKLDKIAEALLDECCTKDPSITLGKGTDNETCVIVALSKK